MLSRNNIHITGLGICCSAGNNLNEVWRNLADNKVNCSLPTADTFAPHAVSPLFTINTENILSLCSTSFLKQLESPLMHSSNRTIQFIIKAVEEALAHAEIDVRDLTSQRIGIAMGTTVGCTFHNETYYIDWKSGHLPKADPVFTYLSSNIAERLQAILQVSGPRAVITNACASGTDAIGLAKRWLEDDLCDIAIAGGGDEISRIACHGFSSLMLFSQTPCKPFDTSRQGLNLGEGAGVMILEKEISALARKANPLGKLLGYGAASDAYHPTAPHPDGRGLQQAINFACSDAAIAINDIHYINAHGTGTKANDQAELTALKNLGADKNCCPVILSTKGATGHTLGAAGGIEAVITLKALTSCQTPGTAGCLEQDPRLPLKVLQSNETALIQGKIGMSQSLAFGGGNAALILEANS